MSSLASGTTVVGSTAYSGISAKVIGFESLQAKLLQLASQSFADAIKAANDKNADEFIGLVRSTIPRGEGPNGHLVDSLAKEGFGPTGIGVSIGDAEHKYPMHLETGHRVKGGAHVPGKPYWYPAKRVQSKRWRGRSRRAGNKMVKAIAAGAPVSSSGD
jgi:hypothetical protein